MTGLAELCWFVERNDPWEIQHFATPEAAVQAHVDSAREDHGFPWSTAHVFGELSPAVLDRCPEPCIEFTCPECETTSHRYATERTECVCCDWIEERLIMSNEPEATVPAMDVERRAEQLYAEFYNVPPLDRMASAVWSELSTTSRGPWRARAQSELAEEAKRAGDHDTLREMHGTIQTVTGAGSPVFAAVTPGIEVAYGQLTEATRELTEAVRVLVLAVQDLDDTVEDDGKIDAAQDAAEVVANLLGIGGN